MSCCLPAAGRWKHNSKSDCSGHYGGVKTAERLLLDESGSFLFIFFPGAVVPCHVPRSLVGGDKKYSLKLVPC